MPTIAESKEGLLLGVVSQNHQQGIRVRTIWNSKDICLWHLRQLVLYRWREVPLEILLFVCWLLVHIVPGFNMPQHGRLRMAVYRKDKNEIWDYGYVGCHLVVTAGKNYIAACFDGTSTITLLKFHGFGLGSTAAAAGDTALQTELTTQYAVSSTRPTGSQAHSTNTYTTIGTLSPSANVAITEWGLLTQAGTGGGTLLDHQVFSAVNLVGSSDSLQVTYTFTQN